MFAKSPNIQQYLGLDIYIYIYVNDTVDGRNPAPVDMVNILIFTGFYISQVVSRISSMKSSWKGFGCMPYTQAASSQWFVSTLTCRALCCQTHVEVRNQ